MHESISTVKDRKFKYSHFCIHAQPIRKFAPFENFLYIYISIFIVRDKDNVLKIITIILFHTAH